MAKHRCLYLWAIRWRTILFMVKLLSCWYLLLSVIRVQHFLFNYNAEYVYVYDMAKKLMCFLRTFKQRAYRFGRSYVRFKTKIFPLTTFTLWIVFMLLAWQLYIFSTSNVIYMRRLRWCEPSSLYDGNETFCTQIYIHAV